MSISLPLNNIVAQGLEGTVNSIQILYTVIITFDNRAVIMPNSKLYNEVITNITHEGVRRLDIALGGGAECGKKTKKA